jgi:hypothetical protein
MGRVRAIFKRHDANDHVTYWGLQHDIPSLLAQTDLLLLTSQTESFCLAALEAMACGVPVLAPRVGGLPEVVIDGETGILFEVDDHAYAADAAVQLLSDPVRLQAMREAAAQHARGFSHREGVDNYETLYSQLLDAHTNGRRPARLSAVPALAPYWEDRHPDHAATGRLVREACFLAGVQKVGEGPPHRPEKIYYYMISHPFDPSLVVDISTVWDRKMVAVKAYESQFNLSTEGPETPISQPGFMQMIEARSIWFGKMIGASYGEPFFMPGPVPMRQLPGAAEEGQLPNAAPLYNMY